MNDTAGADAATPFPYDGPESLREPVLKALTRVVDPEVAMSIVDVGLIYGVSLNDARMQVRITMTSAACPVADVIIDDVEFELERVIAPGTPVDVQLVWEPPWTPERMTPRAKRFMGW